MTNPRNRWIARDRYIKRQCLIGLSGPVFFFSNDWTSNKLALEGFYPYI